MAMASGALADGAARIWARSWPKRFVDRYLRFTYETVERTFEEQTDPWGFETSRYEQARFVKMLELARIVPHRTILEVGCAEGHFTEKLLGIAERVTAIDLSSVAIARARVRAPQAQYVHITLENFPTPTAPFDIVVCSEMLYYVPDKERALSRVRELGRYLLTSNCNQFALLVERRLSSRFRLLRRVLHCSLKERKMAAISLWEL